MSYQRMAGCRPAQVLRRVATKALQRVVAAQFSLAGGKLPLQFEPGGNGGESHHSPEGIPEVSGMYAIAISCLLIALTASCVAGDGPAPEELRAAIEHETLVAEAEGYVPHLTRQLLKSAEVQAGEEAKPALLRAKGALLDLKLPLWARELRYYRRPELDAADPDRGVAFLGAWVENAWPGQWLRGHSTGEPLSMGNMPAMWDAPKMRRVLGSTRTST